MKKIAVIYWSGTGNTELMAQAVAEGASLEETDTKLYTVEEAHDVDLDKFYGIALGCPSMGAEELEDGEFEPYFESIKDKLKDKRLALFGSYDWGTGEWMETWQDECEKIGAILVDDGLIVHLTPQDNDLENCHQLGQLLAQ